MTRSLLTALALSACCAASAAFAQSSDYGDGTADSQGPALIMPRLLTNPLGSGLDTEGYGATATPDSTGTIDAPSDMPYSVEGEEQLEPDTN